MEDINNNKRPSPNKGNSLKLPIEITQNFKNRFNARYKELNLTYDEVAQKAGINRKTIDNWIYGKKNETTGETEYTPPSIAKLIKIARVLGVSLDYLMNPEVDCLTMTNQMICDKTGLSDKAINNLGKIGHICEKRNELVDSSEIDMLNYIVGQDNFYDFLHYLKFFFDNEFRVPLALEGSSYVNANTSGAIVLGKKMIDNAGNDGYAAFADDISKFTDSYAIYNIEKILNTWKDNYKDN